MQAGGEQGKDENRLLQAESEKAPTLQNPLPEVQLPRVYFPTTDSKRTGQDSLRVYASHEPEEHEPNKQGIILAENPSVDTILGSGYSGSITLKNTGLDKLLRQVQDVGNAQAVPSAPHAVSQMGTQQIPKVQA